MIDSKESEMPWSIRSQELYKISWIKWDVLIYIEWNIQNISGRMECIGIIGIQIKFEIDWMYNIDYTEYVGLLVLCTVCGEYVFAFILCFVHVVMYPIYNLIQFIYDVTHK